jgi:hypothetical protein
VPVRPECTLSGILSFDPVRRLFQEQLAPTRKNLQQIPYSNSSGPVVI